MKTRFDWQVGDDNRGWEPIAQESEPLRRGRIPRWVWAVVLTAVAVATAGGYVTVRQRYEAASQQTAFQIQSVIDLEARAFEQGDEALFLAQQDETSVPWYTGPMSWGWTRGGSASGFGRNRWRFFVPPVAVLPAVVEDVDLRGDVAWVQVVEGDPPLRRVRFYRQTDRGWLHAAPDLDFWQEPVEHHYGEQLVFYYHRRDRPTIDPLVEHLGEAFYRLCASADCPADEPFEVLIYPECPESGISFELTLPSPWLAGIPAEEDEWIPGAALDALERNVIVWATGRDVTSSFPWWQAMAAEQWLGVSPITPEMIDLGAPLFRRGYLYRGRPTGYGQ